MNYKGKIECRLFTSTFVLDRKLKLPVWAPWLLAWQCTKPQVSLFAGSDLVLSRPPWGGLGMEGGEGRSWEERKIN